MNEWGTQERVAEQLLAREAGQVHVGPPPTDRIVADGLRIRRRRVWGSGIAAVAVVAAGAGGLATQGVLGDGQVGTAELNVATSPTASARLAEPVDPVPSAGPGQWLHVRSTHTQGQRQRVWEAWAQGGDVEDADREHRILTDGELYVDVDPVEVPAIVLDEDASEDDLLTWLTGDSGDLRGGRAAFERAAETLGDPDVPEAFKARLVPVLLRVPGARLAEDADFAGPGTIVVGRQDGGWEQQFAFDRASWLYVGYRSIVDNPPEPEPGEFADELGGSMSLRTVEVVDSLPKRARGKGLSMRG